MKQLVDSQTVGCWTSHLHVPDGTSVTESVLFWARCLWIFCVCLCYITLELGKTGWWFCFCVLLLHHDVKRLCPLCVWVKECVHCEQSMSRKLQFLIFICCSGCVSIQCPPPSKGLSFIFEGSFERPSLRRTHPQLPFQSPNGSVEPLLYFLVVSPPFWCRHRNTTGQPYKCCIYIWIFTYSNNVWLFDYL